MSMPDKPAHDWESPASRKASPIGEVGQPPIPPDGNGPAPGETHPQEGENAPRICGFDWESLASGEIPPQYSQNVPGINGVDWGSLASDTTPRDEETEQRSRSPDRIGPVPDRTSSTDQSPSCRDSSSDRIEPVPDRISSHDESASYRGMPSVRKGPASRRPSPQGEGAGNLARLILIGYLLPLLTFGALTGIDSSHVTLRMPVVLVCFGPAFLLALWGLRIARRENHAGAAAHACALLLSLLYGVDACLLQILSVEADPGPPAYYGDLFQVLDFLFLAPARLFSRLFHWGAILLGGWAVLRVVMGCMTLLGQKSPGWLARHVVTSFMAGAWLLLFSGILFWAIR